MKMNNRILVIGDLMLDEWVYGEVHRLSPEAPIPIVDVLEKKYSLGGAGNVLANLRAINTSPIIIGGISNCPVGNKIKNLVNSIANNAFYFDIPMSFKKQRICANNQQIVRIDTGVGRDISGSEIEEYLDAIYSDINAVLIADYGKGMVNEEVLSEVSDFCYQNEIPFLIDPYVKDYYDCERLSCTLIKFNRTEAEKFTNTIIEDEYDVKKAGKMLLDRFDSNSILITLGREGMAYFDKESYRNDPLIVVDVPLHVFDVCGAGDVVFSVLGKLMADKEHNIETIIRYAAKAGRLAVSKKGTSVVTYNDIFMKGI
jgi:rfaE bifunctional protein kinase chain/domain